MIVFDLRCEQSHVFEAWFNSSAAYDDQRARSLVQCPVCGDSNVGKAAMAPNIAAKGNRVPGLRADERVPDSKALLAMLAKAQAEALANSQWVGGDFAKRARAMHHGDEPAAQIHGEARLDEARAMLEEGIALAPLPLPVVPPQLQN